MPRPRKTLPPVAPEANRRASISIRSIVKYDPMAPRPTTPIMIGEYVVARRPLQDSIHTLYMVMDGVDICLTSISIPSEGDCNSAITAHRRRRSALTADRFIAKAKKRRSRVKDEEVPA